MNSLLEQDNNTNSLLFSHKQLILLCNYIYFEGITRISSIKNTLETLKTKNRYNKSLIFSPGSGIKNSDAIKMFMDIEKDPILRDLVAVDYIDNDIRAIAFVHKSMINKENADAIIVFQGTKGSNAPWFDNLSGCYTSDTKLQLEAAKFYKKVSRKYKVTYITGHSKGGNLAQYITITNGATIKKCVSFDSQGFSDMFVKKYINNIKTHTPKIVSISSYKDPIHTFLNNLAHISILIKTNTNLPEYKSHVPSLLYKNKYFDNDGNYKMDYLTTASTTLKIFEPLFDKFLSKIDLKRRKLVSRKITPVISYTMPLLHDKIARESR